MDQESRSAAHIVRRRRVQIVAVVHALEGSHVAKGVGALGQRANGHLALAGRVVSARSRLAAAAAIGINVATIISCPSKVVLGLRVGVRATSGHVQPLQDHLLVAQRCARRLVVLEVEVC